MFSKKLIDWYLQFQRSLPWRCTKDPYAIWLSEIIFQQTRINQGLPYFEAFYQRFPTVRDLAEASVDEVLKLWQGLGYYSRARNLHETAKYISKELGGVFPQSYSGLLKLKGVGDYTASAIASICYDEPTPVVDGNVYRVLSRYKGIDTPINSTQGIREFKEVAHQLLDKKDPGTYNQALMEFGALQCKPKTPVCLHCPFVEECYAFQHGQITNLPVKLKKTKIKKRFLHYFYFVDSSKHTLLRQRNEKGIWQGLFEFPYLETTSLTLSESELVSYLDTYSQSKDITIKRVNIEPIIHKLSHQHLSIFFYRVETPKLLPQSSDEVIIPISNFESYAVPVPIQNFGKDHISIDTQNSVQPEVQS